MTNHKDIIAIFFDCFNQRDFQKLKTFCTFDIYYFDPLYNLLRGEDVFIMWEHVYGEVDDFSLATTDFKDDGDGYYVIDLQVNFKERKQILQAIKAYIRIEEGMVSEYSSAFSIHGLCKQRHGIIGNLLGWNRLYQNRIKNDARRKLLQYKQTYEVV